MSEEAPAPLTPEHHNGLSALALLAGSEHQRRMLYLLSWRAVQIAVHGLDNGTSVTLPAAGWAFLPFGAGAVDAVVADFDSVPEDEVTRRAVLADIRRVLAPGGRCVAVITHRRRPRDTRNWSRYRLVPPLSRWRPLLSSTGFDVDGSAHLVYEGDRLSGIQRSPGGWPEPCRGSAGAVALVLAGSSCRDRPSVDAISESLAAQMNVEPRHVDRIHVRKIGKAAAFTSFRERQVVLRLPCSPVAVRRAVNNHAALTALHDSGLAGKSGLVPQPLARGTLGGRSYFVETCVPGTPRVERVASPRWEPQALEFITDLHRRTARREVLSSGWFQHDVEPLLDALEQFSTESDARAAIGWARESLRAALVGREAPLVRSHGDFTGANCLYDANGRLSGIVDWELSSAGALPLLDLLQCLDLPFEYTPDGRWHLAEILFDGIEGHGPLHASAEVMRYVAELRVPVEIVPSLLLFHWIEHVGRRIRARHADQGWMRRRIAAPLVRLRELARSGSLRAT